MPAPLAEVAGAKPARSDSTSLARRAFLAMLVGNVSLAFGPWLVRLAEVGPLAAGFWRLSFALPLVALLALRSRAGEPHASLPRSAVLLMVLAGLLFAADLGAWHAGIARTRLANSTLFGNCSAFLFAAYGFWLARAWPGRVQAAALALAVAGTALLLGRSYELSSRTLTGDLLSLLAGVFYFLYLVAIDRGRAVIGPWPALAIATAVGAPPLLALALLTGEQIIPGHFAPLVVLAVSSQVLGQGLIAWSIAHVPPLVMGLGFLTQPVVAAAIGWIAYDERLDPLDLAGGAAIAAALVLVRLRR